MPPAIRDAPELHLGLEFTYLSFWRLNSCRPVGWGAGPLPWTVIADYAAMHEIEPGEREEFVHLIREMDGVYLNHLASLKPDAGG